MGGRRIVGSGENSSFRFTIKLNPSFDNDGNYTTEFNSNGYLVTKEDYLKIVDSNEQFTGTTYTSEEGYIFYKIMKEGKCYYVFDFGGDQNIYFAIKDNHTAVAVTKAVVLNYNGDGILLGMAEVEDVHSK